MLFLFEEKHIADAMNKILIGDVLCVAQYHQIQRFFMVDYKPKTKDHDSPMGSKIIPCGKFFFSFYANHPLQGFKSHCSVRGYKLLLQQKLIDPPLECCEIVICWKAFIGEGVPNGCGSRKKAWGIVPSPTLW